MLQQGPRLLLRHGTREGGVGVFLDVRLGRRRSGGRGIIGARGSGKAARFLDGEKRGDGGFKVEAAVAEKLGSESLRGVGDANKLGDEVGRDVHNTMLTVVRQ